MSILQQLCSLLPVLLLLISSAAAHRHGHKHEEALKDHSAFWRQCLDRPVHKSTFRSPEFSLGRGQVYKKFYGPMEMPSGHYAIRSFTAQIVGENGPVPLNEVYVHHWIAFPAFRPAKGPPGDALASASASKQGQWLSAELSADEADETGGSLLAQIAAEHEKVQPLPRRASLTSVGDEAAADSKLQLDSCLRSTGSKLFGVGAETRHTLQGWTAPYGMEFGNPKDAPAGQVEQLFSQIHVIDTHGAVDAKKCLECFCESYNVTVDERGRPLPDGYTGGLLCCYHDGHCATTPESESQAGEAVGVTFPQTLWLEYTVEWVEMDECVVPVKVFFMDVTEDCSVEYDMPGCEAGGSLSGCIDTRRRQVQFPIDGTVVYGGGHQHVGADGITLWKEDGSLVCDSTPIYGRGSGAGNEAGYVTGIRTCRPEIGQAGIHLSAGEQLTLQSTYSKLGGGHTGVMGLFYIAVLSDEVAKEKGWLPPSSGTGKGHRSPMLALGAKHANETVFRLSMVGAVGGFMVGVAVTGLLAGLVVALTRRHLLGATYSIIPSQ